VGDYKVKVHELITELLKHDPDAEVMLDGYESGVSDVRQVIAAAAYKNEKRPSWYGRYELNSRGPYTPKDAKQINVVFLPRLDDEDAVDE
jgi:hypothetical protein